MIDNFFVQKIANIHSKFKSHIMNSISFLKIIIPKPNCKFTLKPPSVARVKGIIPRFKNSSTLGFDNISTYKDI